MSLQHQIYALVDPRDNEIRYIGKSVNPQKRLNMHLFYASHGAHTYALRWIKGLLNNDLQPILRILEENISTDQIDEREKWWIAEGFRRGWRLTNMTEGGDGGAYKYPESGAKISAALKGKKRGPISEEHRQRLIESHKGKKPTPEAIAKRSETVRRKHAEGYKRPPKSQESIERQRQKLLGRKQPAEEIKKRAAAARGRKHPEEWRKNISEGLKRRHYVHPPETIEKIAAARRGKPISAEHKAALIEGQKRARARKKAEQKE